MPPISLLDKSWAETLQAPLIQRPVPEPIENAGQEVPSAGEYYTAPWNSDIGTTSCSKRSKLPL